MQQKLGHTTTGCPINMGTRSTLIFSFCISAIAKIKPLLKSLDSNLQGATLILIFFKKLDYFLRSAKNETKQNFFGGAMPPSFFQNVPRFCFLRFMYPGTWIWRKNKIPCTRLYGFEEETKFHVPGYMNLRKQNHWHGAKKFFSFVSFFVDPKK